MPSGKPTGFVQVWIDDPGTVAKDPDIAQALRQSTYGQSLNESALLKRLLEVAEIRAEMPDGH